MSWEVSSFSSTSKSMNFLYNNNQLGSQFLKKLICPPQSSSKFKKLNTNSPINKNLYYYLPNKVRGISFWMEKLEASVSNHENSFYLSDKTTTFDTFKRLIIMFISCFLKSLFGLTCKILLSVNPSLNSFSLLTYKVYLMIIISFIFGLIFHIRDPKFLSSFANVSKANLFNLFCRSLFSVFASSLLLFALKYMQISDVYSIYYTYPGIVIFLSYLLLKENFTWLDLSCFFSSFIGAICVVRPSYLLISDLTHSIFDNTTFFCVMFSACFKASEDIIIRKLGKNIHWLLVPLIYACTGSIIYPFQNLMFTGENFSLNSLLLSLF